MVDNIVQQLEELETLEAIFGDCWKKCDSQDATYSIKISDQVELWITLNDDYPSDRAPQYDFWAPKLNPTQKDMVNKEFARIYDTNKGYPVIFQWIEKLKEIVNTKYVSPSPEMRRPKDSLHKGSSIQDKPPRKSGKLDIVHGPAVSDRKSTFQGHACRITHASQAQQLVEELLENKKVAQATHNILAYRVQNGNQIVMDYDEDGENQAGSRLTYLLEKLDVINVAVVVTRWYGGVHLGPDRFKHITNAAHQALLQGGFITTR